jgi:hypothetical protein
MMSLAVIRLVNEDIAQQAARERLVPYVPWDANEAEHWRRCPLPNLGYFEPPGWERLEASWFIDKTGVGQDWEPALTWKQFRRQLSEYVAENPGHGFGIVEEGVFQCVVAAFRSVDGDAG